MKGDFDESFVHTSADGSRAASAATEVSLKKELTKRIYEEVNNMLNDFGTQSFIANLSLLGREFEVGEHEGTEDPALVTAFISSVHDISAERIRLGETSALRFA